MCATTAAVGEEGISGFLKKMGERKGAGVATGIAGAQVVFGKERHQGRVPWERRGGEEGRLAWRGGAATTHPWMRETVCALLGIDVDACESLRRKGVSARVEQGI